MRNHRDYLAEYLASDRAFLALLRRIGARMIPSLDLPRPILDLGCADGQSQHFAEYVFLADLFAGISLKGLSRLYKDLARISWHYRTDFASVWTERLQRFGFAVRECNSYLSRGASHVFDLAHSYSAPTLIYKKLPGRWILAPWRANFILIEPILRRWYDESPTGEGAYLYFMCERK